MHHVYHVLHRPASLAFVCVYRMSNGVHEEHKRYELFTGSPMPEIRVVGLISWRVSRDHQGMTLTRCAVSIVMMQRKSDCALVIIPV